MEQQTPESGPGGPIPADAEPQASAHPRATLPREMAQFLLDLSIALHRSAMYPPSHPALAPALEALARRVNLLLEDRQLVAVGVARDRLVVQGVATDARQPILRALADLLHRHHLAAFTMSRGLTLEELTAVVAAMAEAPERGAGALGDAPPERLQAWPHVAFHPMSLGGLEISGEGAGAGAGGDHHATYAELWVGLARAALERSAAPTPEDVALEPAVVARAIDEHQRVEAYDQVVVGYMLQIAEQLRVAGGPEAQELRRRTARLVASMQPETLRRLLDMSGDALQRQRFVSDAAMGLSAPTVVDLLKAASEAGSENVSHGMVRMLSKLAAHADAGTERARPLADSALRDQVQRLLAGWDLADPNPEDYRRMLQQMSRSAGVRGPDPGADETDVAEPLRVIQMALELDQDGPAVDHAVRDAVDRGDLPALLDLLPPLPRASAAGAIWTRVLSPEIVQVVVDRLAHDPASLDALLPYLSGDAIVPVMDLLLESPDRHVRRQVFDRLRRLGSRAVPLAVVRLEDERWYATRNLLSLLAQVDDPPGDVEVGPWLLHADARVRREAVRLALRLNQLPPVALASVLRDPDPGVVSLALVAVADRAPVEVREPLLTLVGAPTTPDDLRAAAVRALARANRAPEVLELVLRLAGAEGHWNPWRKLPSTTQTLVAAIAVLAQYRPRDTRAQRAVHLAAESPDPLLRQAARVEAR